MHNAHNQEFTSMMFPLVTVIGLQFNRPILPKPLVYLISLLVAPKANDGHASPSIGRNLRRKYVAQIAGNGVSGLQISNIFRGACPRTLLVMRGLGTTVSFGSGSAPGSLYVISSTYIIKKCTYTKTRLVRLWCDNAPGQCWENTREACKTLGYASCFTRFSRIFPTFPACIITQ